MGLEERTLLHAEAADEFNRRQQRGDGGRVVESLTTGLNLLRDSLFIRVQADVEKRFGMDSMLSPISLLASEKAAKAEIDIYQVAESAAVVGRQHYLQADDGWYLQWLKKLRLGAALEQRAAERLGAYASKPDDERRRAFSTVLERTFPEASRAPLVIFRLFPLAASIVTAIAFGDHRLAQETRKSQTLILGVIADCHTCRGHLLEIGEVCQECGNPLWKYDWLTAD